MKSLSEIKELLTQTISSLKADAEKYSVSGGYKKNLGFWIIANHRATQVGKVLPSFLRVPIVGATRTFAALCRMALRVYIPSKATFGPGVYMPHPSNIWIPETSFGSNFTVFHDVTIGTNVLTYDNSRRIFPVFGNNVAIFTGAKVLGPITISDGTMIGANCVVSTSILEPGKAVAPALNRILDLNRLHIN